MTEITLLACPFCGDQANIWEEGSGIGLTVSRQGYRIVCKCCVMTETYRSKTEVKRRWNTRHKSPEYEKLLTLVQMIGDRNNRDFDWYEDARNLLGELGEHE